MKMATGPVNPVPITRLSLALQVPGGLRVRGCSPSEPQRIVDALADGKLVVALMTKGHFTKSGHFIVLRGVTSEGEILVADPASYQRSNQTWDLSIILNEASRSSAAGGHSGL